MWRKHIACLGVFVTLAVFNFHGAARERGRRSGRAGKVSKGGTEVDAKTLFYLHEKFRCPLSKRFMSVGTRNIISNTGSTVTITGRCNRTKQHTPVVGVMIRKCGGALAQFFRTFHSAHHIRSQWTACRTSVSLCRTFIRQRRKRSWSSLSAVDMTFVSRILSRKFFHAVAICGFFLGPFRRSRILFWAVFSSAKICLGCFLTQAHFKPFNRMM